MSKAIEEANATIIAKIKGVAAQPGTPETDADPRNPNNWVDGTKGRESLMPDKPANQN